MGAGRYLRLLRNQLPASDAELDSTEYLVQLALRLIATGVSPEFSALRAKAVADGDREAVSFFDDLLDQGETSFTDEDQLKADIEALEAQVTAGNVLSVSSLSGDYGKSVVVSADVTLTADTTVYGDLTVIGDLLNPNGYALTVKGSLRISGALNFTTTSASASQGDLVIGQDLILGADSQFQVNAGQNPQLVIKGSMIGPVQPILAFDGKGKAKANGLTITVSGEVLNFAMDLSGGDASASGDAGNGGSLTADGYVLINFTANGGNSNIAGRNAGAGGSLYCFGPELAVDTTNITLTGGNVTAGNGNAGNGGHLEFYNLTALPDNTIDLSGGNAAGTGAGGNGGDLLGYVGMRGGVLSMNGGDSTSGAGGNGTTPVFLPTMSCGVTYSAHGGSGATTGGAGGNWQSNRAPSAPTDSNVVSIDLHGGNGGTGDGGAGGSVEFAGSNDGIAGGTGILTVQSTINVSGGSSTDGNGGPSGNIRAVKLVLVPQQTMALNGGTSTNANGGAGGIFNSPNCENLDLGFVSVSGGAGGSARGADGSVTCASVHTSSAASLTGNTTVTGDFFASSDLSNPRGHGLNVGGDLIFNGVFNFTPTSPTASQENVTINGDLLALDYVTHEFQVNAGQAPTLTVGGDCVMGNEFNCSGRTAGANGLTLDLRGDLIDTQLYVDGGQAVGATAAGSGGTVYLSGNLKTSNISARGGAGAVSTPNSNGGDGGLLELFGDTYVYTYLDVSGGVAYTAGSNGGNGGTIVSGRIGSRNDGFSGSPLVALNGGQAVSGGADGGNGGNGGTLRLFGELNKVRLEIHGGLSDGAAGGNAGTLTFEKPGFINGCTIDGKGGDGLTTGGNGFNLGGIITSDASFDSIDLSGGSGSSGAGGSAGSIQLNGLLTLGGSAALTGGGGTGASNGGNITAGAVIASPGAINLAGQNGGTNGILTINSELFAKNLKAPNVDMPNDGAPDLTIKAPDNAAGNGGWGGNVNITGGSGDYGRGVNITGGAGNNAVDGFGGDIAITGGAGNGDIGGAVGLIGGASTLANGGNILLNGGAGQENGGSVNIFGGTGQNDNGGDINLRGGESSGAAHGAVIVTESPLVVDTAHTPSAANADGRTGQIAWDGNYIYICVAPNTWKRAAIATW
jgi:hypothetical protein